MEGGQGFELGIAILLVLRFEALGLALMMHEYMRSNAIGRRLLLCECILLIGGGLLNATIEMITYLASFRYEV